jgi:hypothetical protein
MASCAFFNGQMVGIFLIYDYTTSVGTYSYVRNLSVHDAFLISKLPLAAFPFQDIDRLSLKLV